MRRLPALFLPAAVCALASVAAQQSPPPVPQFRTRVDLVVLDVSVLDPQRRPVRDLTAADFTVLEDGRPQAIQMFTAVDIPDPDAPSGVETPPARWLRDVASDVRNNEDDGRAQIFLLVLDDANPMEGGELAYAQQYARRVIDGLGPHDLAAVMFLADRRSGQEFTRDRERLLAAVARFNGPPPGTLNGRWEPGALQMLGPMMAMRTLRNAAESLAALPAARKAVIYISTRGAAAPDVANAVASAGEEAPARSDAGRAGSEPASREARAAGATGLQIGAFGDFGEFVRAAQRANVNVYCLDPGGLRAPTVVATPPDASSTTTMVLSPNASGVASLAAISASTGAFAIVGTNDPAPGIAQVFRENRSYYLLAYASSNARTEGRYRSISVRVNRPGLFVRSRHGYFEPDRKEIEKVRRALSSQDVALAAPVAKADIPLHVTAAPFASAGTRQAAVAVALAIRQGATDAGGRVANLDVTVNAYDYLGKRRASERLHVRAVLRPAPGGDSLFEVAGRLDVPPGRYQLRAAVSRTPQPRAGPLQQAEAPSGSGSVFCDLDVPDFASERLSLSGVVLSAPRVIRTAGGGRLKGIIPVLPTTLREFVPGDDVQAFVRVYQGGKDPVAAIAARSRIADRNDRTVFDKAETIAVDRFVSARAADWSLPVPLAQLKPGPYLLTIEATLRNSVARRQVRFTVR